MSGLNRFADFTGPMVSSTTDVELVRATLFGESGAFSELVRRHQKALLRVSLRFARDQGLAEDIVQESFIKAYQKLRTFEGRASFKSWLFQIAINTAKNRLRGPGRDTTSIDDSSMGTDPGAETFLMQADVRRMIRREVDLLPEKQKLAITLRVFEDLSFKEIADIMDCPYDTAKANYRHALLKLRKRLDQGGHLLELRNFDSLYATFGEGLASAGSGAIGRGDAADRTEIET